MGFEQILVKYYAKILCYMGEFPGQEHTFKIKVDDAKEKPTSSVDNTKKREVVSVIKEKIAQLWRVKSEQPKYVPYKRLKNYEGFAWGVNVDPSVLGFLNSGVIDLEVSEVEVFPDKILEKQAFTGALIFKVKVLRVSDEVGAADLKVGDVFTINFGSRFDGVPYSNPKDKVFGSIEDVSKNSDGVRVNFSERLMSERAAVSLGKINSRSALNERYPTN